MKSGHTSLGESDLIDDIGANLDRISAIEAGEDAEVQVHEDGPAARGCS